MAQSNNESQRDGDGRYEFRVWGDHRKAQKKLADLATEEVRQEFEDCYFLSDDPDWNAKVRNSELKVKQLIGEARGFERWASEWHPTRETAPNPYDDLFDELRLDRPQRGKSFDLPKAVAKLDPDGGTRAVFVTKSRRRYRLGAVRAEITDVEIRGSDDVLRTLSIEGEDLNELSALRKSLGLRDAENLAMHVVIDDQL